MRLSFLAAGLLLTLPWATSAQSPRPGAVQGDRPADRPQAAQPARDTARTRTGSGVIVGRVVAADTGAPLRRVQVRASATEARDNRLASTDADGRYELTDLPAGRYSLSASKAGFVTIQFGQLRPFESGRPVTLADGQKLERMDFALPRGSVLTGRITDEYGEPVAEAIVQAMRYRFVGGSRQLAPAGRGTTNDIGQYRIFGLSPGEYYLSAFLRASRGFVNESDDVSGYAPTFYPGTPGPSGAQRLSLAVGQELANVDFALTPARVVRVSGTVVDSAGRPVPGGVVTLGPRPGEPSLGGMGFGGSGPIRSDGSFTIANVTAGDYTLVARQRGGRGSEPEFGLLSLTLGDSDVSGVTIVTTVGGIARGQIVFDGGRSGTLRPGNARVSTVAAEPSGQLAGMGGGNASVGEDWTFELRRLAGSRLVRVNGLPSGWTLKAVLLNGVDVTDAPIDFGAARKVDGLQIVLTDRATEVTGTVADGRGRPIANYVVLAFAEDARLWGYRSRFVASARPDQDGGFRIRELPPGRYLAVALEWVEEGIWTDPDFLARVHPSGAPFTLAEGETRTLTLRLSAP